MTSGREILTVGHSNHEERAFLELLRGAGVELLADVRANPHSRYPQFNRSALAGTMKAAGIGYAPLGPELGGRREPRPGSVNTALEQGPIRGYADHMATDKFLAGLDLLEDLAAERRTAVLCAEADWHHCHRRLLADLLTIRGWRVLHLGPDGSLTPHELSERVVIDDDRITYPAQQTTLDL